jgi:galactokinase
MTEEALKLKCIWCNNDRGGFGGCTVNIVREDNVELFINQVGRNYKDRTVRTPEFYRIEICDGARDIILKFDEVYYVFLKEKKL